jgi:hypothetical protein
MWGDVVMAHSSVLSRYLLGGADRTSLDMLLLCSVRQEYSSLNFKIQ